MSMLNMVNGGNMWENGKKNSKSNVWWLAGKSKQIFVFFLDV